MVMTTEVIEQKMEKLGMNAPPLTDAAERFPLGVRNGIVPTNEGVTDSDVTPFGLTLRAVPEADNIVHVDGPHEGATMGKKTVHLTEITTDGNGRDKDVSGDNYSDELNE